MISTPVSSPCAPAAGCSVTAAKPAISASISCSSKISCSAPWTVSSGSCSGWMAAKPGSRAATSLTLGLYFIVHDPSG